MEILPSFPSVAYTIPCLLFLFLVFSTIKLQVSFSLYCSLSKHSSNGFIILRLMKDGQFTQPSPCYWVFGYLYIPKWKYSPNSKRLVCKKKCVLILYPTLKVWKCYCWGLTEKQIHTWQNYSHIRMVMAALGRGRVWGSRERELESKCSLKVSSFNFCVLRVYLKYYDKCVSLLFCIFRYILNQWYLCGVQKSEKYKKLPSE